MENKEKNKAGRKKLYGEETTTLSIAVPISQKEVVKKFVENLLISFRKKS